MTRVPPSRVLEGLETVQQLQEEGQFEEADLLLRELAQQYPKRIEILVELANVAQHLHDPVRLQLACKQILALEPGDPDATLGLASAYLQQAFPALAVRTFQKFLDLAPQHEKATHVRDMLRDIEPELNQTLEELSTDEALKLALEHEEVQALLNEGDYWRAERLAKSALRRHPDYPPLLNNLSLIYRQQGRFELALQTAQQVLELEPHNIHALANLIQYLCFTGRAEEARAYAEPLKNSTDRAWEEWVKKAEGLTLLGDEEGVLEVHRLAHAAGDKEAMLSGAWATLAHYAAVAAAHLGRETEARRLWNEALNYRPSFDLAVANLEDLQRPQKERNGAWAFSGRLWFSAAWIQDIQEMMGPLMGSDSAEGEMLPRNARRLVRKHPEFVAVFPVLLKHADPMTRNLALLLADLSQEPALLAAVKDFALGQRGSDDLRLHALQIAGRAQLLPQGEIPLWIEGEWRDVSARGLEVTDEPTTQHGPKVMRLLEEASAAASNKDWKHAEELYARASALEPHAPDLQGNRAVMIKFQGREAEAEALLWEVHKRFPEYVFARLNLARLSISRGELEIAHELLDPVLARPRLHGLEFLSLCNAEIELALAENDSEAAHHWLELWETYAPEDPGLGYYRARVEKTFAPPPPTPQPRARRHRGGL